MSGTILVTGGGGLVGSAVVRVLVRTIEQNGPLEASLGPVERIVAVVRPGSKPWRLETVSGAPCLTVDQANILDPVELTETMHRRRPSVVIHCALDSRAHDELSEGDRRRIIGAPIESLVTSLADNGGGRFIYSGSAAVLGAGTAISESAPRRPRSAYGENKTWEEDFTLRISSKAGIPWINLRLFYLFGRYESPDRLLPYIVRCHVNGEIAHLGGGDRMRDYSSLRDVAEAFVNAATADPGSENTVFHIGSGSGISIRRFAETVAEITQRPDLLAFDRPAGLRESVEELTADARKAERLLGWKMSTSVEQRLREVTDWWLRRLRFHKEHSQPSDRTGVGQ